MPFPRATETYAATLLALCSFGCDASSKDHLAADAAPPAVGDSAIRDARVIDARVDASAKTCESLQFEVAAGGCGASCAPVQCSCAGAFPKSLAKCAPEGCLIAVDCAALCAVDLGFALGCTDHYTVRQHSDAGALDGGATDGGALGAPNGAACTNDEACASGRCALLTASGTCVAGSPGDTCAAADDCASALCSAGICAAWAPLHGGAVAKSNVTLSELRALADGYTVAGMGSAVNFGAGVLDSGRIVFLAEYASDGTFRSTAWAKVANTTGAIRGARLADGSRRLVGDFYTTLQSGSSQLSTIYSGNFDLFAAGYDGSSALQWAKRYGATGSQLQSIGAAAYDSAGATYLTGTGGNIDFGAGAVSRTPFLAKLNADGTLSWAKAFDADDAKGQGLAVDPADGSLVWAGINGGVDALSLGGGLAVDGFGIFLARYSAAGAHVWSKGFKSFGASATLALGPNREIVMTGSFRSATSFGGTALQARGLDDIYVARFDAQGAHVWSRALGGSGTDRALAVAIDSDGSLAVGGLFQGTTNLGSGPITAVGEADGFVARFAADGALTKVWLVQGPHDDEVRSLAFSAEGLLVAGLFSGTQDFGSGAIDNGMSFVTTLPR
jgi:hypothetical protein